MVTELFVPERKIVVPKPPSYLALDMAFGIGAGATLFDKSRYRSHGSILGASWAAGLHGYCLDFNPATPSYVSIPADYDQLDFTSEKFSIIARLLIDDFSAHSSLYSKGRYNQHGHEIYIRTNGDVAFRTFQTGASQVSSCGAGTISSDTYTTLGLSRDGEDVYLYKNGVDATAAHGTHIDPLSTSYDFNIGAQWDKAGQPFRGKIEFFKVFRNIALPASALLAWHNALA